MPGAECTFPRCGAKATGLSLAAASDWLFAHERATGHDHHTYGRMSGVYTPRQREGMNAEDARRRR